MFVSNDSELENRIEIFKINKVVLECAHSSHVNCVVYLWFQFLYNIVLITTKLWRHKSIKYGNEVHMLPKYGRQGTQKLHIFCVYACEFSI